MISIHMRFAEYIQKKESEISAAEEQLQRLKERKWHATALEKQFKELMQIPDTELSLENGFGVIATIDHVSDQYRDELVRAGKTLDTEMSGRLHGALHYIFEKEQALMEQNMYAAQKAVVAEGGDSSWMPSIEPYLRRIMKEKEFPLDFRYRLRDVETEFNMRRMSENTYNLLMNAPFETIYEYIKTRDPKVVGTPNHAGE